MGTRRFTPTAVVLISVVLASSLGAAPARGSAKASRLYVPVGYDDNDEVVVVVEGYLETTCEQIRGALVSRAGKTYLIEPRKETQGRDCDKLKVPYTVEVVLNPEEGIPAGDDYQVQVAGWRGKPLTEPLTIAKAPTDFPNSYPYAPVDNVEVGLLSGGKMRAVVEGRFQNTCMVLDRIELDTKNGKTYELLPITKPLPTAPDGKPCAEKERRFTAHKDFLEPTPGRYLLHVRTQSGAVNRIFTNVW